MKGLLAIVSAGLLLAACRQDFNDHGDPATFPARFQTVAEGTVSVSALADPAVFLARTKREGERAARRVGIEEVARILRSWTDYRERALIVVLGGSRPDPSDRVLVERLDAPAFASFMKVWARLEASSETTSSLRSVPWIVVSTSAEGVLPTQECVLRLIGHPEVRSPCKLPDGGS